MQHQFKSQRQRDLKKQHSHFVFELLDPFDNTWNEFNVLAFDSSNIQVSLCFVVDDKQVEPTEVATFRIEDANSNGASYFIGFPDLFWVSILDDDASASTNLNIQNAINLYPVVSSSFITLSTGLQDLEIKSVYFYSSEGKYENTIQLIALAKPL